LPTSKKGNDYSVYINSSATGHVTTLASDVTDTSPNLPTSTVWTINGRTVINGCCGGVGGVADELRLSNQALSPSQFLVTAPVFPVTISIKPPAKAPVPINLGSGGVTPVAIFSSSVFDATQVDPSTIRLSSAQVSSLGGGRYSCNAQNVNGDGKPDLVCRMVTNEIQLQPPATIAILTGMTFSGVQIQGAEAIRLVPASK
jgi:hypothetical protein